MQLFLMTASKVWLVPTNERLSACGVLDEEWNSSFYSDLLLAVARSLRMQLASGRKPDSMISNCFESNGFKASDESLFALEELVQLLLDYNDHRTSENRRSDPEERDPEERSHSVL
jgi:hypothetical protein